MDTTYKIDEISETRGNSCAMVNDDNNKSNNEMIANENKEHKMFPALNKEEYDEKLEENSNNEELSSNDSEEQNIVNNSKNSQFYESSDSKLDYAVKVDDNDTLSDIEDIKTDSASADSEDSALGSLPPDITLNDREEEVQDRSDGSDSGIGSETPEDMKLSAFNIAIPCTSGLNIKERTQTEGLKVSPEDDSNNTPPNFLLRPVRSSLKRKPVDDTDAPQSKKKKYNIRFDDVTVYYFPRTQGFICVPSQGGSTLGMEWQHTHVQKFTLVEHALEQRRLHKQILQQLKSERHSLQGSSLSSSEDSDTEEEASDISESELDLDSYFFLQPVPTRQRRALLRAAGVRKIEGYEKDECRDIRTSRELCGCACKGACNPETCSCSLGGIKCQVDRLNFPCGCTRDGCANTTGRIEFNPVRVRTHFIHTLMRIGFEKKNEENHEAAKRQWMESQNPNLMSNNSSYVREHSALNDDGLLRDVNLTPRVEVESCVNAGSFNNVHCEMNNPNVPDNVPYGYRNEATAHRNMNDSGHMRFDNSNNHCSHAPYTSNILQGKGPPYSTTNTMTFNSMATNMQNFSCNLNYSYEQRSDSHSSFKGLQSFSATSFEEFAHSSQMSMFNHYGHMYVPNYVHKVSSLQEQNTLQYSNAPNHYDMYKTSIDNVGCETKDVSHYGNVISTAYQSNKLQTVDNDENWFSHNTLLNLDQCENTTQDASDLQQPQPQALPAENLNEPTTENFGELIKKTMVESVSV